MCSRLLPRRLLATVVATIAALLVIVIAIETWARLTWDPKKGRPGFFVSDPIRIERLAPNYDGWFAGVPVHTNSLGFRDSREYALSKAPNTFRIIVLGDSVTFGHGSIYEHTYPLLLEQRLRAWRPSVDWQVWNLGVPGYDSAQELSTLLGDGPRYQPDLVIVGFLENDVFGLLDAPTPSRWRTLKSSVTSMVRANLYSYDWFRRRYLTLRYRWVSSEVERRLLEDLAENESLLSRPDELADAKEQQLTNPLPLFPAGVEPPTCNFRPSGHVSREVFEAMPNLDRWKAVVQRFQQLNAAGTYRILFFLNEAPHQCLGEDRFVAANVESYNDYFLEIFKQAGVPAVSSYSGFLRYKFSDMPMAAGHSIGNSNAVKAAVLFDFLSTQTLPALLPK
jgi:hypothetical protein